MNVCLLGVYMCVCLGCACVSAGGVGVCLLGVLMWMQMCGCGGGWVGGHVGGGGRQGVRGLCERQQDQLSTHQHPHMYTHRPFSSAAALNVPGYTFAPMKLRLHNTFHEVERAAEGRDRWAGGEGERRGAGRNIWTQASSQTQA